MFRPEPPAEISAWEAIMPGNGASSGFGDDWLKFAGIKIFYDGGMTLRTALIATSIPIRMTTTTASRNSPPSG